MGELVRLKEEGKIRHVGLSNVSVEQLRRAQALLPIVSVQNRYNLSDRVSGDVIDVCAQESIGFLPWYPLATGALTRPGSSLDKVASRHGATLGQVALAWLLYRSPVMLPIPGTASIAHLEENVAAATLELTDSDLDILARA